MALRLFAASRQRVPPSAYAEERIQSSTVAILEGRQTRYPLRKSLSPDGKLKGSLAVSRRTQIPAEERDDMVLKAISDGAGVGPAIDLKAVGYAIVVENIVQLLGIAP